jgi:hypothetical protein
LRSECFDDVARRTGWLEIVEAVALVGNSEGDYSFWFQQYRGGSEKANQVTKVFQGVAGDQKVELTSKAGRIALCKGPSWRNRIVSRSNFQDSGAPIGTAEQAFGTIN